VFINISNDDVAMEPMQSKLKNTIQLINFCLLILKSKQKREKVRQIHSYPFLLPKSYSEPYNYNYQDWFKDQLFACNVQVDFHNCFFLNKF
jgi:hypothetical protein